jgi:hypothetical protein
VQPRTAPAQRPNAAVQRPSAAVQPLRGAVQPPSSAVQPSSAAGQPLNRTVQATNPAVQPPNRKIQATNPAVQLPNRTVQATNPAVQPPNALFRRGGVHRELECADVRCSLAPSRSPATTSGRLRRFRLAGRTGGHGAGARPGCGAAAFAEPRRWQSGGGRGKGGCEPGGRKPFVSGAAPGAARTLTRLYARVVEAAAMAAREEADRQTSP